jgi:hypothetical protein
MRMSSVLSPAWRQAGATSAQSWADTCKKAVCAVRWGERRYLWVMITCLRADDYMYLYLYMCLHLCP